MQHEIAEMRLPLVSVITAVRNEENNIRKCITQLIAQDYPRDRLEIIVVDGGSEDKTVEVAESLAVDGVSLTILKLKQRGRSQGLNSGIRAAKGEVIVRIDARSIVGRDYVSRCVATLLTTGADNVGGVRRPIAHTNTQEAIGLALSHPFGTGSRDRIGLRDGYVDSVYLGCFRRDVFEKVGLFDEEAAVISEDSDINQRIRKAGGKVFLNSQINAYYYPRESFISLCRLYFRYGGAQVGNLKKHGQLISWRYAIAPIFILFLVFAVLFAALGYPYTYVGLLFIAAYAVTDFSMSFWITQRKKRLALLPKVMLAFPCMHISWGLGFWKRLLVPMRPGTYWDH